MKKWLIHLLGGVTRDEASIEFIKGKASVYVFFKKYADNLYGVSADKWCSSMYNTIEGLEHVTRDFHE